MTSVYGVPPPLRSVRATARRRGALLQLARKRGEVRVRIGGVDRAPPPGGADVSELLDALNTDGLLRYAGLRDGELRYLPA